MGKDLLVFAILLFLSGVLCHHTTLLPGCSPEAFEDCMSSFRNVLDNNSYVFPDDKEKLDSSCSIIQDGYACLNDTIKRCLEVEIQQMFFAMLEKDFNNFDKLCTPSDSQESYLKHASCYREIALQEDKCKSHYQAMITPMKQRLARTISDSEYMNKWCCESSTFIECFQSFVDDCGHDASEIATFYLELTTGYENDTCVESTSNFTTCVTKIE